MEKIITSFWFWVTGASISWMSPVWSDRSVSEAGYVGLVCFATAAILLALENPKDPEC